MNGKVLTIAVGIFITLFVHGALALAYSVYRSSEIQVAAKLGSAATKIYKEEALLCAKRRCRQMEKRQKRLEIEPANVAAPEILEAAMVPALGGVEPNAKKLPELQTYEQPKFVEDGINLEGDPSKLDKLFKKFEEQEAKKDPKSKKDLDKILAEEETDERKRAKALENLTGFKEGEVNGQGLELKLGSMYSTKVAREISKVFKTPPFLDDATLKKLQMRVQVQRMSFDGAIEEFRIVSRSNDRSFDDAAMAAIKQFVPREGGQKQLPVPEPEVLRFINAKGLTITLDGRLMRR